MPTTATKQGITMPTFGDAPAVPTDLLNLWNDMISRGLPRYASTAQRDTEWPSPTEGQHAVAAGVLYVYQGAAWKRVWSPPIDWTSSGIAAGAGVSLSTVQYKVNSQRQVEWRGEVYGASTPAENAVLLTFPGSISPPAAGRGGWDLSGLGGSARVFVGAYGGTGALTEVRFRAVSSGGWPSSSTLGVSLANLHWSLD